MERKPIRITATALSEAIPNADALRRFAFEQSGAELGQCRSCHVPIFWGQLQGRAHPFDLGGESHFATCPDAERWRRDVEKKRLAAEAQHDMFDEDHGRGGQM